MPRRYRLEIILVVAIVAVVAVYVRWAYIPSFSDRHVEISEEKYDFDVGEPGPWFSAWSLGDGQAYVLIALDPTGDKLAEEIPEAGYRFARAGYGWAGWAASIGRADFVPYALALVGAVCLVGVLALAVRMRPVLGPRSWLMVLNPALFIGFAGDTSEPMGILFLAMALAWGSWVAATLLGVTRPTFLVALWGRWKLFLVGVGTAALLAIYVVVGVGPEQVMPGGGRLGMPLFAYIDHPSVWGLALASASIATVVVGALRRDYAWILSGLFVLCLGSDVLRDPINAWRSAGLISVLWAFGPGFQVGVKEPGPPRSQIPLLSG